MEVVEREMDEDWMTGLDQYSHWNNVMDVCGTGEHPPKKKG